jgi:hypothetical protein
MFSSSAISRTRNGRHLKTLILAAAIALASPALAQQWLNQQQLDNALQTYAVDQQLNALAAQARRDNQNTFNQNPIFNQRPAYSGCTPAMWAWCH